MVWDLELNLTTKNKGQIVTLKKLWKNEYVKVNIHLVIISTLRFFVFVLKQNLLNSPG